jgi:hypothetical protein
MAPILLRGGGKPCTKLKYKSTTSLVKLRKRLQTRRISACHGAQILSPK